MYLLATVRNTGSNWALGMLERHFERFNGLHEEVGVRPHVFFSHTDDYHMPRIRELIDQGYEVIRTIRHPDSVARSWRKRGWVLDQVYISQWRNLFSLPGDLWLSVDTPDREKRLADVSAKLGVDLETDWQPVCSFQGNRDKGEGPQQVEITGHESFYQENR